MRLIELWNQPSKIEWHEKSTVLWDGLFTVGDMPYNIYISKEKPLRWQDSLLPSDIYEQYKDIIQTQGIWGTVFSLDRNQLSASQKEELEKIGLRYEFMLTKTGNPVAVLSTVVSALREFVNTMNPALLLFEAKGESRIRLYERIVRQLGASFEKYKAPRNQVGFLISFSQSRSTQ